MLVLSHSSHQTTLSNKSLIVIENASENDYLNLANEDLKIEFDGACLYIHSSATKKHENLVFLLLRQIKDHLSSMDKFAEAVGSHFAIKLPNDKRPEPDIVVVKWGEVTDKDSIYEGIPILIVEITSPSTRNHDLTRKLSWLKEAKVPEIWIIDRETKIFNIYTLSVDSRDYKHQEIKEGEIDSSQIKGLRIKVKAFLDNH